MTAIKASRISLQGPSARGTTIAAAALKDVLDILLEGSQRAVRLAVEGRSTARGTVPAWLDDAASFDLTAIEKGSTQLAIASRPLREVVPQHFAQLDFFGEADGESSGIEVFARGLSSAVSQDLDSELFDAGLLRTYARFNKVLDRGFETIEFLDGVHLRLDRAAMKSLAKVQARVPPPQQVRVAGKLEQIQHSDRRFSLVVGGTVVRGVAQEGVPPEQLGALFGRQVVVNGQVMFRPSGTVLRLEADAFDEAGERATLWEKVPRPLFSATAGAVKYLVPQGPRSGIAAIIGKWPGDEDDSEIAEALEHIS